MTGFMHEHEFSRKTFVKGGVAMGVSPAVNVQVAFWSATATALPASSAESKTTLGQSNVAPSTWIAWSPGPSRSCGPRPRRRA